MRVVSLLASGTEIVCALGAGDWLVGRSHECDNPAWVQTLPQLSAAAFNVTVSSKAIDAEVNRRIRSGEPLYLLENAKIAGLKPDLIITQAHCEVCAVSPGDLERSGCLVSGAAQVMALTAGSLEGVFEGIQRVAPVQPREQHAPVAPRRNRERASAEGVRHGKVVGELFALRHAGGRVEGVEVEQVHRRAAIGRGPWVLQRRLLGIPEDSNLQVDGRALAAGKREADDPMQAAEGHG